MMEAMKMGCFWWDRERGICRFPWKDYDICLGRNCKDYIEDDDVYMNDAMAKPHEILVNEKIPKELNLTLK